MQRQLEIVRKKDVEIEFSDELKKIHAEIDVQLSIDRASRQVKLLQKSNQISDMDGLMLESLH